MKNLILKAAIFSAIHLLASGCWMLTFSQSDSVAVLEQQLAMNRARQDSLLLSLERRKARIDSLSARVAESGSPGLLERTERDRLLRETQRLAQLQEESSIELNHLRQQEKRLVSRLIDSCHTLEQALVDSLQNPSLSPGAKAGLRDRIAAIRKKQSAIAVPQNKPVPGKSTDIAITIDSNDMPVDIEAKALLLRDRVEIHRQKALELRERYKKVQQEQRLRQRLADMVDDVRLFDARDEAVAQSAENRSAAEEQSATFLDNNREAAVNPSDMGGLANTSSVMGANELLNLDIQSLPNYNIQDYLSELEKQQKRLLQEADSLSRVADRFEREAEKLRKSISPDNE